MVDQKQINIDIFSEINNQIPDIAEKISQYQLHTPGNQIDDSLMSDFLSFVKDLKTFADSSNSNHIKDVIQQIDRLFTQISNTNTFTEEQIEFLFVRLTTLSKMLTDQKSIPQHIQKQSAGHSMKGERSKHLIFMVVANSIDAEEIESQVGYYGYTVKSFPNTEKLINEIVHEIPHAIIIDSAFSKAESDNLHKIAQFIEKTEERIPVIFISENEDITARLQAVQTGGKAFFIKPIDFSSLIDSLDQMTAPVNEEPYRVMIVEDTFLQAKLFSLTLNKNGMETRIVTDPLTILEPLKEFNPDLILLDMYMPSCTGMELAKVIRQMEYYVSIPIVYLSAETDIDKQLEAMSEGADDFLAKPIKPNHLITAVTSKVKRYRKLRALMLYDGLTGLFNHTTTLDRLSQEISRSNRHNEEIIFSMLDLDEFKKVNDTYGHSTGDHVLKSLSLLLKQRLRKTDIVGRLGGEEFGVILPNTTQEAAVDLMNQLRENFANIHHRFKGNEFYLTFSCGIASSLSCPTSEEIHEAADKALYQAKHQGRNQVVCYQTDDFC